ncbi:MAG TPA: response regulator, partial [Oscillospiraceae bacterium]|nr:response regulator [Oscillospiraceae bacterium]
MEQVHILLIEDDPKIVNFMSMALKAKNYKVTTAATGKQGVLAFCTQNPDILLLDLGLPDMDGVEVAKRLREITKAAIIVLSAREQERDKVDALDAGADDYLTKPF